MKLLVRGRGTKAISIRQMLAIQDLKMEEEWQDMLAVDSRRLVAENTNMPNAWYFVRIAVGHDEFCRQRQLGSKISMLIQNHNNT